MHSTMARRIEIPVHDVRRDCKQEGVGFVNLQGGGHLYTFSQPLTREAKASAPHPGSPKHDDRSRDDVCSRPNDRRSAFDTEVPAPARTPGGCRRSPRLGPARAVEFRDDYYGMYTERMCRLRDARIEARRKLHREVAWFCITLAAGMTLWAAA